MKNNKNDDKRTTERFGLLNSYGKHSTIVAVCHNGVVTYVERYTKLSDDTFRSEVLMPIALISELDNAQIAVTLTRHLGYHIIA